jgi:hypothetical protein
MSVWIEGTVKAVSKKEGKQTGILLTTPEGEKWYNESKRLDGPFQVPNRGERVKMLINDGVWITQLIPANGGTENGAVWQPDEPEQTQPVVPEWTFKDKDHSIAKQVCLKAAVEFSAGRSATSADVVADAEAFWQWMNDAG